MSESRLAGASVPTVLVIEDDAGVAETIVESLRQADIRAVHVNRGDTGLSAARTLRFSAIILDLILPGRSGIDVLRELHGHPTLRDVPVVVLSAMAHVVPPAVRQQAAAVLAKPFVVDNLVATVRDAIRARSTPADNITADTEADGAA